MKKRSIAALAGVVAAPMPRGAYAEVQSLMAVVPVELRSPILPLTARFVEWRSLWIGSAGHAGGHQAGPWRDDDGTLPRQPTGGPRAGHDASTGADSVGPRCCTSTAVGWSSALHSSRRSSQAAWQGNSTPWSSHRTTGWRPSIRFPPRWTTVWRHCVGCVAMPPNWASMRTHRRGGVECGRWAFRGGRATQQR